MQRKKESFQLLWVGAMLSWFLVWSPGCLSRPLRFNKFFFAEGLFSQSTVEDTCNFRLAKFYVHQLPSGWSSPREPSTSLSDHFLTEMCKGGCGQVCCKAAVSGRTDIYCLWTKSTEKNKQLNSGPCPLPAIKVSTLILPRTTPPKRLYTHTLLFELAIPIVEIFRYHNLPGSPRLLIQEMKIAI